MLGMACGSQWADPRALAGFGRRGTARCVRGYAGTKTRVATLVRADVNGLADVALEARGDRGRETDAAERRTARNLGAPRTLRSAGKPRRTPEPIPRCTVSAACTDCGLPRSRRGPAARIPCDTCFLRWRSSHRSLPLPRTPGSLPYSSSDCRGARCLPATQQARQEPGDQSPRVGCWLRGTLLTGHRIKARR